jgi:Flp pilus assembly protein TadD
MRIRGVRLVTALALVSSLSPPPAMAQPATPATGPAQSPTDQARALVGLATLRAVKQNWAGAEEAARAATALDPTMADAWHELAHALAGQDRTGEAIAAWEEALLRDPQHTAALEGLGRLYAAHGERARAEALLERLRPLDDARAATLHHAIELGGAPGAR